MGPGGPGGTHEDLDGLTVRAATRENTSTDLTVFEAKMCSRQAVSKRLLRSYTAAFLDGIFWSASRSSVPKNELESGSPPPKCGPKNGSVFGALGIRANIRILPAGSKNGSQFRSRFWSHFFTLFGMHFIAFFCTKQAQNFQNHNFFLVSKPKQPQHAAHVETTTATTLC